MIGRRRLAAVAGCVVGLLLAASVRGEKPWYEHYTHGLDLETQGAWAQAFLEFQAAARTVPIPEKRILTEAGVTITEYDPHYHLALCLTELGRPHLAAEQLKAAAGAHVTPQAEIQALRKRIQAEVAARGEAKAPSPTAAATPAPAAGRLSVDSDPPGAAVFVDGDAAGTTPLGPLAVAPGPHVVRAEAAGYRPAEERVTIAEGATETLLLPLAAIPAPTPPRAPKPPTPHPTRAVATATPAPAVAAAPPPAPAPSLPPPTAAPRSDTRPAAAPEGEPWLLGALLLLAAATAAGIALRALRRRRSKNPVPPAPTGDTAEQQQPTILVETGAKLGQFALQSVLGRGGMATTYRARRGSDGQTVALKVPHEGCLSDQTFVTRFLREGNLGEQLHHPRIVRIFAAGEDKGRPFLAMEVVEGHTLKQEIRERAPLPLKQALEITRDIAEALDYAHAKGVVHRDLKPENVMLLPDGTIKVMDFGIARLADQPGLTTSNIFLGTPLYAAPEMVDPKSVDHRVDLYALGIILYEMLEGGVPFTADSPFRVIEMHMRQPLPAPERLAHSVPAPVWAIILRLCEKDPAARYQSAETLLVELNRLLQNFSAVEAGDVF